MPVLVTVPKISISRKSAPRTNVGSTSSLDFIVWTSIDYGITRVGGPVMFFDDDPDLSQVTELCIVGHGSPGQIEGRDAAAIAARLTEGPKAVPDSFRTLIVTSCYAGVLVGGQKGTAVIDVLAAALRARGITGVTISGAMGPSIKANELGSTFRVVSDSGLNTAGQVQNDDIVGHGIGVQTTTGVKRLIGSTTDPQLAGQAAEMMAKISGQFYREFVAHLEDARTLLDPKNAMRTVTS